MIKLTFSDSREDYWVNPDNIVSLRKVGDSTEVRRLDGFASFVSESPEEISDKVTHCFRQRNK